MRQRAAHKAKALRRIAAGQAQRPDPQTFDPSPAYLRKLIEQSGLTHVQVAKALRVTPRTLRAWLADPTVPTAREAPYSAQFALEMLATMARK